MRPLPTESGQEPASVSQKDPLPLRPARTANQKRAAGSVLRIYPLLLVVSTSMAGGFCYLYLTKPVIQTSPPPTVRIAESQSAAPPANPAAPLAEPTVEEETLAREPEPSRPRPSAPQGLTQDSASAFEETNLKIQHVLTAQGPGQQDLGRIVLDVPVVYPSGTIRWSQEDVAKARSLLVRLDAYQLKANDLRNEAVGLISEWDQLIVASIPEPALRADSPTLPENQGEGTSGQSALDSSEVIEIEP